MKITDYIYDRYERGARLYPSIITTIPLILLVHFYNSTTFLSFFNSFSNVIIGDVALTPVLIFALIETNKLISKDILQKFFFKDEQRFPTTNVLLWTDEALSSDLKAKIHKKILNDFGIKLLNQNEEKKNEDLARKKINEAVKLIIRKTRGNKFILNENIHYGFWRNLAGGAVIALPISFFDLVLFISIQHEKAAAFLSLISALFFASVLLLSKLILSTSGKNYAKVLITEYSFQERRDNNGR